MADSPQPLPTNPDRDPVEAILELALHEEQGLADRANWLDTKTGAVMGFVIVSVAELLGFLFLASAENKKLGIGNPCLVAVLFCLGTLTLLVGMVFGLLELFPKGFKFGIETEDLTARVSQSLMQVQQYCIDSLRSTSAANRIIVQKKETFLRVTVVFVGVSLLFYTALVVMLFFSLL